MSEISIEDDPYDYHECYNVTSIIIVRVIFDSGSQTSCYLVSFFVYQSLEPLFLGFSRHLLCICTILQCIFFAS